MPFDEPAKNAMLTNASGSVTAVSLHSADPGVAASNEVTGGGYARQTPTFAAAAGGVIALSAPLAFTGPADQPVSWFAVWAGATRYGKGQITTGDVAFNAAGEYSLTTGTQLTLTDA